MSDAPLDTTALLAQIQADMATIQGLATQIRDLEQFEAIVRNIQDPVLRSGVRQLLIPLVPFYVPPEAPSMVDHARGEGHEQQ